jgi:sec-independent protein translocase protein TatC
VIGFHNPTYYVRKFKEPETLGGKLKRRAKLTLFAYGIGAGASWFYRSAVFLWLLAPAGDMLSPFDGRPVFSSPIGMMGATIAISLKVGIVTAFPVFWYSVLSLIKPWLPIRWWRFFTIFILVTSASFAVGVAFVYYVMLPAGLRFLLNFGEGVAVPLIEVSEYLDLFTSLMLWVGAIFELPTFMFLLARGRLISYQQFKSVRKFVPAAAYILSIVLTPSVDWVNTTMIAVPIVLLYEVGLMVAWIAHPELGNYMFVKSLWRLIRWLITRPWAGVKRIERCGVSIGLPWWY